MTASPPGPPRTALIEASDLAREIVRRAEEGTGNLTSLALKAARLAHLLGDSPAEQGFRAEAGGYASSAGGLSPDLYQFALRIGRRTSGFTGTGQFSTEMVSTASIEALEQEIAAAKVMIETSSDNDPHTQQLLRNGQVALTPKAIARKSIGDATQQLSHIREFIFSYALEKADELRFSGVADDVFTRVRNRVDARLGSLVPGALHRFSSAYGNLQSDNTEDWSNAVHSCRRILQELADSLFPPRTRRVREVNGKAREIALGPDNYINRLIAFVEDHTTSGRYSAVVGSHLTFLGDRLDAVLSAAQKGSHSDIVSREEADRYVIYTYLLIGDIISLSDEPHNEPPAT